MSISYTPIAGELSGGLTKPLWPESPNYSQFPFQVDELKMLAWTSPPEAMKVDLARYHVLMSIVLNEPDTIKRQQAQTELNELLPRIRGYVLTEQDYNLMADAILTTQRYILQYMNDDLVTKAEILDAHLTKVINDINAAIGS